MQSERFNRNRRFFVAIFLAAVYGMERFTWREIWEALRMMFTALTSKKGKASDELFNERMETCRNCPVHFPALGTCGSPLSDNPELGCWCFNEYKAREVSAKCWLREKTDINSGWLR